MNRCVESGGRRIGYFDFLFGCYAIPLCIRSSGLDFTPWSGWTSLGGRYCISVNIEAE